MALQRAMASTRADTSPGLECCLWHTPASSAFVPMGRMESTPDALPGILYSIPPEDRHRVAVLPSSLHPFF